MPNHRKPPKSPKSQPSRPAPAAAPPRDPPSGTAAQVRLGSLLGSVSGPSDAEIDPASIARLAEANHQALARQRAAVQQLAAARPCNAAKALEYGAENGGVPREGVCTPSDEPLAGASTVNEEAASEKTGEGDVHLGHNPGNESLDRVRVDSQGQALTTAQGVRIADNQHSLRAGLRGPTLLEDFVLLEKVMHFDHERIPERVVHARGSGAHGYFECTQSLDEYTAAAPFAFEGKRTPVFVRFSTVAGERGSTDLARDVRGFAVKFYTDEGIWDLVGNNMPVFFIQDAMKFPDLVHALKPEPHHAMPQAASAHDTFWDFVSLMPESTHMLMWLMSDRAIPRSYRMMQGFGVHTFRFVNKLGEATLVKFHWTPLAGTHSLVWDEAVKLSGADPDFHRRDLWEAIEAGNFARWDLQLQLFSEEEAEAFSFDVLDPTKLVPEELVPLRTVGRLVLDRNPDNFFAETEQVAFCTSHVVPGIDFTNDPLLQGRNFSYQDTQLTRLGGPNFHEIPINASLAQTHNNQRDGLHRQAIHRGRVSYEPNSLGGGCPFQAGLRGFASLALPVAGDKLRAKPEKFADHYTQARLFWASQSPIEQRHIVAAYAFELTKVQTPAVRERVVSMLANVHAELAAGVAAALGIAVPQPMPMAIDEEPQPEVTVSQGLSLLARPGDGEITGRRVALLAAEGLVSRELMGVHAALLAAKAAPRFVASRLGRIDGSEEVAVDAEITFEAAPSAVWDAVVVPDLGERDGASAVAEPLVDFVRDQYRHGKPILMLGANESLAAACGLQRFLPDGQPDPGIVICGVDTDAELGNDEPLDVTAAIAAFEKAIAAHRHHERMGL
ncbi:catalase [Caldimonas sp. KR1-144]|uniref:catalase n=1 Tax=Caldimonas sp. KR1-144 TaxID=3400911 RepID=UPI003BFA8EB3